MIVERIDLLDFKLHLDGDEFEQLKAISENKHLSLEEALNEIIYYGLDALADDIS